MAKILYAEANDFLTMAGVSLGRTKKVRQALGAGMDDGPV